MLSSSRFISPDLVNVQLGALLYVSHSGYRTTSYFLHSYLKEAESFFSMLSIPPEIIRYDTIDTFANRGGGFYLSMHANSQMVSQVKPEHFALTWAFVPVRVSLADLLYPPVPLSINFLLSGKPLCTANHQL